MLKINKNILKYVQKISSFKEKSMLDNKRTCHLTSDVRLDEKNVKDIHW